MTRTESPSVGYCNKKVDSPSVGIQPFGSLMSNKRIPTLDAATLRLVMAHLGSRRSKKKADAARRNGMKNKKRKGKK